MFFVISMIILSFILGFGYLIFYPVYRKLQDESNAELVHKGYLSPKYKGND